MTKDKLYSLIQDRPLYLDGATGSNLQKAGMPTGCMSGKMDIRTSGYSDQSAKAIYRGWNTDSADSDFFRKPAKTSRIRLGKEIVKMNSGIGRSLQTGSKRLSECFTGWRYDDDRRKSRSNGDTSTRGIDRYL